MRSIRPVQKVIDGFEALPGIGPKSAARLAYYLLNTPQERLERFAEALENLKIQNFVNFVLTSVKKNFVRFVRIQIEVKNKFV
jgi:recombinational DNA repair protein RecR